MLLFKLYHYPNPNEMKSMNGVYATIFLCKAYGPGIIWVNEMKFGVNRAPGAGSIVQPVVDLQSSARTTTVLRLSLENAKDCIVTIVRLLCYHSVLLKIS